MIADLEPYPEYKESGLPWLGQVPGHWEMRRLRHACEMRVSNVDKHTKHGESRVRLCNYVEVYKNERIRESTRFMTATASEDERIRFGLRKGDVLITKDSEAWNDIGVPALVEFEAPDLVCGYHLAILRPRPGLQGAFLHRALESRFIAAQFHVEANGVTRYGLSQGAIKGVGIPLPPPSEQTAIVRFLDWANGRLERAIRAKRKVVALLNEQKQAIIHRAVTRGLDPSVPLKPSGIPWLGDIPKHWEVRRLKSLVKEAVAGPFGSSLTKSMYTQSGYRVYGQQQVIPDDFSIGDYYISKAQFEAMQRYQVTAGDVLVSVIGTVGRVAVVPESAEPGIINPRLVRYRADGTSVRAHWVQLVMQHRVAQAQMSEASKGTTMDTLNMRSLGKLLLLTPPLAEQDAILEYVARERQPFTNAVSRLDREVELLREYRTRLVADVVTGKLDVREAAAHLPDEAAPDAAEDDSDLSIDPEGADEEAAV